MSLPTIFSPFFSRSQLRFYHIYFFAHIPASNTVTDDDVANYVSHRIFNTNLLHSSASFTLNVIAEKSSLGDEFEYDLMIIR